MIKGLIAAYVILVVVLLLVPAPEPWQVYIALPALGAVVQFVAANRGARVVGMLMTVVGVVILVLVLNDHARWREKALRTIWENERHQAEQSVAPLPRAPAGHSDGAR